MLMRIKKMKSNAIVPTRGTIKSAGLDLFCCEPGVIHAGKRDIVKTEIAIALPAGSYGRVAPRSGLSCKYIDIGAGVVDLDYRNGISILILNNSDVDFKYDRTKAIAQLIVERIYMPTLVVVDELDDTERGLNGFGSTDEVNLTISPSDLLM